MSSSSGHSIRRRLILALALGLGTLLTLVFLLLDRGIHEHLNERLDSQLLDRARTVNAVLGGNHALDDPASLLGSRAHSDYFTVWDVHGGILLRSPSSAGHALERPPGDAGHGKVLYDLVLPDGHRGRAVAMPGVLVKAARPVSTILVVAVEREDVDALGAHLHLVLIGTIVFTTLCAVLLAFVLVNRGLRPLVRLGARVARLDPDHPPAPLADARMPVELVPLAEALDTTFQRQHAALQRERRFTADVAHELRTPLAEIRASLELAQRQGAHAREQEALAASLAATGRLQAIVDGLLALAQHDARQADAPQLEPLDLVELLNAQCRSLDPGMARLRVEAPAEFWTQSDPLLLERICANLLQNAIEYAPAGSPIELRLQAHASRIWLEVGNAAPGLDADDIAHLGERFWRKQTERTPSNHSGLGIALSQALATALGLTLGFRLAQGELIARLGSFTRLQDDQEGPG